MRRKIKHSKHYKDYPKNVPRRLLKEFFQLHCSVTKLASACNVNSGIISKLLNDGIEPKDKATRVRLHLSPVTICPKCGRRIVNRTKQNKWREEPAYIKKWKHLSTDERQAVIRQYLEFKYRPFNGGGEK
jgi:hypothetical protein